MRLKHAMRAHCLRWPHGCCRPLAGSGRCCCSLAVRLQSSSGFALFWSVFVVAVVVGLLLPTSFCCRTWSFCFPLLLSFCWVRLACSPLCISFSLSLSLSSQPSNKTFKVKKILGTNTWQTNALAARFTLFLCAVAHMLSLRCSLVFSSSSHTHTHTHSLPPLPHQLLRNYSGSNS